MWLYWLQDFEALQGRADSKTAFYEALSRSLGGATGSDLLKEAAAWFYSLDHSPSAAGYNLFSRALDNATRCDTSPARDQCSLQLPLPLLTTVCMCSRDLFIICPSLQMASHWANSRANVFLYHQPSGSHSSRYQSPTAQPLHSSILIRSRFRSCPTASKSPASASHFLSFWSSTTERVAESQ